MLTIRKSEDRGFADHGWLKSHHTFSFANYFDPKHKGFRKLRVINEDYIAGGAGFGSHPHRDMEIITYVMDGALEHKDSMGTQSIIRPGEVQRMSAGTGVVHSEFSVEPNKQTHLFQIWIHPNQQGVRPSYGQKSFESDLISKKLVLVISRDAREGSLGINQDADMFISRLTSGDILDFKVREGRGVWLQLASGEVQVNEAILKAGDALSTEAPQTLSIKAFEKSELIIFDLA